MVYIFELRNNYYKRLYAIVKLWVRYIGVLALLNLFLIPMAHKKFHFALRNLNVLDNMGYMRYDSRNSLLLIELNLILILILIS